MTLQLKVQSELRDTVNNTEMLVFQFFLGAVRITCLANIPPENERSSVVYIKLDLEEGRDGFLEYEAKRVR